MINRIRWLPLLLTLFLAGGGMFGCKNGIFNTEPFVDTTTDAQGNRVAADTQRNWQDWRESIDQRIKTETAGKKAPGFNDWGQHWQSIFTALERSQENSPRYINYIIEQRRKAGLPELETSEE